MKHKAQEALNDISNILYTTDYAEHIRCQSYPITEDEQAIIKQLLDCQLTVEEVNVLMVCMSYYAMRHPEKTTINGIDVDFMGELFKKLEKQKEMWEEDGTKQIYKKG